MSATAKRLSLAAVAISVYFVLLMLVWATRPLHDSVPVGIDRTPTTAVPPKPEQAVSQRVECNSLFAEDSRPDESLPTLRPQPKGQPALAYQREPCNHVHSEARVLLAINSLVVVVLMALLVFLAVRSRRSRLPLTDPLASGRAAAKMHNSVARR
jgi:hypothetical protein